MSLVPIGTSIYALAGIHKATLLRDFAWDTKSEASDSERWLGPESNYRRFRFVSAVHIPSFAPSTLLSGGGDPNLKLWDWMSGEHLADIPVLQAVEPFIAVRPPKGRVSQSEEDGDDDGDTGEKDAKRKGKGKRGKAKGKGKASAEDESETNVVQVEAVEDAEDVTMREVTAETATDKAAGEETGNIMAGPEEGPLVLVIRRIASANVPSQGNFILFSAVGYACYLYSLCFLLSIISLPRATAVFFFKLSSDIKTESSSRISAFDLGRPIVDFSVDRDGLVWVLVDSEKTTDETTSPLVRLLKWVNGSVCFLYFTWVKTNHSLTAGRSQRRRGASIAHLSQYYM
jgi:tRNA (guanine-N(7)-)-methyltransferase subunit TRM82